MKLGKVALEKLKEPENSIETWRQKVKNDPNEVGELLKEPLLGSEVWPISARQALQEHKEKQRVARRLREEKNSKMDKQLMDDDSPVAKRTLNWTAAGVLITFAGLALAA